MGLKEKVLIKIYAFTYILEILMFSSLMQGFLLSCGYDLLNFKVLIKNGNITWIKVLDLCLSLVGILVIGYEVIR